MHYVVEILSQLKGVTYQWQVHRLRAEVQEMEHALQASHAGKLELVREKLRLADALCQATDMLAGLRQEDCRAQSEYIICPLHICGCDRQVKRAAFCRSKESLLGLLAAACAPWWSSAVLGPEIPARYPKALYLPSRRFLTLQRSVRALSALTWSSRLWETLMIAGLQI